MGNRESNPHSTATMKSTSTVSIGSIVKTDASQIQITDGHVSISTTDLKKVDINGNRCVPCSELILLFKKMNEDPQFLAMYEKYCS